VAAITRLSEEEAARLVAAYGLSLESLRALPAAGTVNSNFAVVAGGRRLFLRVNEGKSAAHVAAEAGLAASLVGVPLAPLLRTLDGQAFTWLGDKPVSLFGWIDGREARPADAALAGEALALLHLACPSGAGLGPNQYDLLALRRRLDAMPAELDELRQLCSTEVAAAQARDRAALPGGVIHQDLFPDNLLVDERGGLAALLDLEQATVGPFVYDVAVSLLAFAWDDSVARPLPVAARALVDAYRAIRTPDPTEDAALGDELRLAAARFAITRVGDVLLQTGTPPDLLARKHPRFYIDRLKFLVAGGSLFA
jgi:homoserine kinase type II